MNAPRLIKREILIAAGLLDPSKKVTGRQIDSLWACHQAELPVMDATSEFRHSGQNTDVKVEDYRGYAYECQSVARKLSGGEWVGWTYLYGGGKHAHPGGEPWIDTAYLLDVTEVMEPVLKFKRKKRR